MPRSWPTVEQGRAVLRADLADAGHAVWTKLAYHCLASVADLADDGAVVVARLAHLGMVPTSAGLKRGRARGTADLADYRAVVLARLLDAGRDVRAGLNDPGEVGRAVLVDLDFPGAGPDRAVDADSRRGEVEGGRVPGKGEGEGGERRPTRGFHDEVSGIGRRWGRRHGFEAAHGHWFRRARL